MLLTISMRICSLSSSVHDEHSRNTMLNSSHCSSSHEFDEVSNTLRTVALTADTITASRISQASRLPVQRVNASMARLKVKSDCNENPPRCASAVLTVPVGTAACPSRANMKPSHHSSAPRNLSIGSLLISKRDTAGTVPD